MTDLLTISYVTWMHNQWIKMTVKCTSFHNQIKFWGLMPPNTQLSTQLMLKKDLIKTNGVAMGLSSSPTLVIVHASNILQ